MLRTAFIVLICIAISGCCGFKLRGIYTIPEYLRCIYITPDDPYEPFQREARWLLAKHHVCIVCEPKPGLPTLELGRPNISEQTLAVGNDGQVQRYQIKLEVTYRLITPDVKYTRTIVRSRELSRNNNQLLSNETEKQTVHRELLEEAAQELIKRLASGPPHTVQSDAAETDNNPC